MSKTKSRISTAFLILAPIMFLLAVVKAGETNAVGTALCYVSGVSFLMTGILISRKDEDR